jgi:hypothetical protein
MQQIQDGINGVVQTSVDKRISAPHRIKWATRKSHHDRNCGKTDLHFEADISCEASSVPRQPTKEEVEAVEALI